MYECPRAYPHSCNGHVVENKILRGPFLFLHSGCCCSNSTFSYTPLGPWASRGESSRASLRRFLFLPRLLIVFARASRERGVNTVNVGIWVIEYFQADAFLSVFNLLRGVYTSALPRHERICIPFLRESLFPCGWRLRIMLLDNLSAVEEIGHFFAAAMKFSNNVLKFLFLLILSYIC